MAPPARSPIKGTKPSTKAAAAPKPAAIDIGGVVGASMRPVKAVKPPAASKATSPTKSPASKPSSKPTAATSPTKKGATSSATKKAAPKKALASVGGLKAAKTAEPAESAVTEAAAPEPPPEPVLGHVRIRYNHYNEAFDVLDGKLDFEEVDGQYCFSFVFKGDWTCKLTSEGADALLPDGGALLRTVDEEGDPKVLGTFSGLIPDVTYELVVEEDPKLADAPKKTYTATSTMAGRVTTTDDGNMMGEDNASCSCLYGNPCASAYNCKDWHNRFDVAKRNGWKGFS